MMNFPRCDGLAVREYSSDLQAVSPSCFHGWRCLNCGMISDDVIRKNQLMPLALRMSQRQGLRMNQTPPLRVAK
jgi:hypothetical protein